MPKLSPIKRKELIRHLRTLGFDGPFSGGKHEFMMKGNLKLWVPNPHQGDINKALLLKILKQANIERDEWENS